MSKLKQSVILLISAGGLWAQVPPPPRPVPNGPAPVLREGFNIDYNGSVPSGTATATPLTLTLRDAIRRGLQFNLGVLVNRDIIASARAERRRALSALLPNLEAGATQTSQQIDLVAFGLNVPGFPTVVGPFGYQNVRAYLEQTVYSRTDRKNLQSATETQKATELNAEEARSLVVEAVSNAYLAIITNAARVTNISAELNTAQALYDRAVDERNAGTIPGIDVLRAEVQLRTDQQRLLAQQNEVEKSKLVLARTIGLPSGQPLIVSDTLPFTPLETSLENLLAEAYQRRADYRAAQGNVRAAQLAVEAAQGERWPTVAVDADYGVIGNTLANSHGTYSVLAGVRVPVFSGGRIRSEIETAQAVLQNNKNVVEDLRGRIDYEVRNAVLDIRSTAEQVRVAAVNVQLATETLAQARDRFTAGVTDNVEVVQAQQLLAAANERYTSSLSAHTEAKIALATALGVAEENVPLYLNLQP